MRTARTGDPAPAAAESDSDDNGGSASITRWKCLLVSRALEPAGELNGGVVRAETKIMKSKNHHSTHLRVSERAHGRVLDTLPTHANQRRGRALPGRTLVAIVVLAVTMPTKVHVNDHQKKLLFFFQVLSST